MAKKVENLPYNSNAEKAVLGSALLSKECLYNVLSSLSEDDFFELKHKILYRALTNLQVNNIDVDVVTMTEALINSKELDTVGGVDYIKECCDSMVAFSSLNFYVNIVKDNSTLRNLLIAVRDIDNKYKTQEIEDINSFIQDAELSIKIATEKRRISSFKNVKEIANEVSLSLETTLDKSVDNVSGLTTGFSNINRITNGFQKGEITIVAARPSVGKTTLAMNFAYYAAKRRRKPVAIFSLEMSSSMLLKKIISADSNVPVGKLNGDTLSPEDRERIERSIREISDLPIYIDDSTKQNLMDIIAKSRQLQAQEPELSLIIIDYLGLITTGENNRKNDSRQEEVRRISLALKSLARELCVPIVVVSQLSRSVESRESKKPMMSDLRDSGNIEQDADVIMLLYRDDYYHKKSDLDVQNKKGGSMTDNDKYKMSKISKQQELLDQIPGDASYVEVEIAKNRNGGTGKVALFFYKSLAKFGVPPQSFEEAMRNLNSDPID